ncbi:hypothetical protein CJ307_00490 [Klebsiella quasipneumoniae]|nr:hypothetical protein CJ307_00490 [Klebsiella quasipneumoniae]
MVHAHTPSAVDVLISHMPFTHFSIYAYLNAICTKNALNMIIYCAKSFSTSLNKNARDIAIAGRDAAPLWRGNSETVIFRYLFVFS